MAGAPRLKAAVATAVSAVVRNTIFLAVLIDMEIPCSRGAKAHEIHSESMASKSLFSGAAWGRPYALRLVS
jgi:hypothetical protein